MLLGTLGKKLVALGVWVACLAGGAVAEPRTVQIATDDAYPPYSHLQQEQAAGLYLQLMRRAAEGLPGWRLVFKPLPWSRALLQAEQAEVDAVLPPYRGMGRDWIALYVGPLHREEVVLSCGAATGLGATSRWPQDFGGRRIGVMRGYLLSPTVVDAVQRGLVEKHEFRNGRDALAALANGQIDCYANDRLSIVIAHQQALGDKLWAARMPAQLQPPLLLSSQQAWLAISRQALAKRPELAEFARELDVQLALLRDSGELQRLVGLAAGMAEKR